MTQFKEATLTANKIALLDNKNFKIVKAPRYELVQSLDKPDEKVEKLIIKVVLLGEDNAQETDFYPNKTSQKAMVKAWGYEMDAWIGKIGDIEVLTQKIRGETRNIMYVKI